MPGHQSKQHKNIVDLCSNHFKAEPLKVNANQSLNVGKYFPDLFSEECEIEVELVPDNHKFDNKFLRRNSSKKWILVLSCRDNLFAKFDEVYIY